MQRIFLVATILLLPLNAENITIETITKSNIQYFPINELVFSNNLKSTYYESKEKQEIIYEGNKLYFSPNSSYCRINENIYHLTYQTLYLDNKIYIPALPMQAVLKEAKLNLQIIQISKNNIEIQTNLYDIHSQYEFI